jgi:hypothetical protein
LGVTKIFRYRTIDKTIQALDKLPDVKKERIIHLYGNIITTNRIALWMALSAFLLFLAGFVLLFVFPEVALAFPDTDIYQLLLPGSLLLVVAFFHFLEDSNYKKKILKAIDKSTESEIP